MRRTSVENRATRARTTGAAAARVKPPSSVSFSAKAKVRAQVTDDTKGRTVLGFIQQAVDTTFSALITDEYKAYTNAARLMPHSIVLHAEGYVSADNRAEHTNTIEGFWALLKRAWYGSHHKYTKGWSPLFVAEACWKYNQRSNPDAFNSLLRACFV